MATRFRTYVAVFVHRWTGIRNQILEHIFMNRNPPPNLAIVASSSNSWHNGEQNNKGKSSLFDLQSIFDGFLLAVPRHRRTIETRLRRKMAFTGYFEHAWPKKNIVPCLECGNFKEKNHLCGHCYEKVRQETKEMQAKLGEDLEFNVPRSETTFIYDGESSDSQGKNVVQMGKARPSWFPRQLLNKTG